MKKHQLIPGHLETLLEYNESLQVCDVDELGVFLAVFGSSYKPSNTKSDFFCLNDIKEAFTPSKKENDQKSKNEKVSNTLPQKKSQIEFTKKKKQAKYTKKQNIVAIVKDKKIIFRPKTDNFKKEENVFVDKELSEAVTNMYNAMESLRPMKKSDIMKTVLENQSKDFYCPVREIKILKNKFDTKNKKLKQIKFTIQKVQTEV